MDYDLSLWIYLFYEIEVLLNLNLDWILLVVWLIGLEGRVWLDCSRKCRLPILLVVRMWNQELACVQHLKKRLEIREEEVRDDSQIRDWMAGRLLLSLLSLSTHSFRLCPFPLRMSLCLRLCSDSCYSYFLQSLKRAKIVWEDAFKISSLCDVRNFPLYRLTVSAIKSSSIFSFLPSLPNTLTVFTLLFIESSCQDKKLMVSTRLSHSLCSSWSFSTILISR